MFIDEPSAGVTCAAASSHIQTVRRGNMTSRRKNQTSRMLPNICNRVKERAKLAAGEDLPLLVSSTVRMRCRPRFSHIFSRRGCADEAFGEDCSSCWSTHECGISAGTGSSHRLR